MQSRFSELFRMVFILFLNSELLFFLFVFVSQIKFTFREGRKSACAKTSHPRDGFLLW